jgi:hypothetical protein
LSSGTNPQCALNRLRGKSASYKTLWREEISLVLQGIETQFPVFKFTVEGPIVERMVLPPIGTKHVTYRRYPLAFVNHFFKPSAAATFSNFIQLKEDLPSG